MVFRKTMVLVKEGATRLLDTVDYEGALWLVCEWAEHKTEPLLRPKRMFRVEGRALKEFNPPKGETHYMLEQPIARAVLNGEEEAEPNSGILMLTMPPVAFPK